MYASRGPDAREPSSIYKRYIEIIRDAILVYYPSMLIACNK